MKKFSVNNYSSFAVCRFNEIVFPSLTPEFTFTFTPGAYALSGQIDNGGWAFAYSLTTHNEDVCIYNTPEFIYDGREVSLDFLRSISCYLGIYGTNCSAEELFSQMKKTKKLKKPLEEIKEMFGLSNERFSKPLSMTGNEVWRITAALGYAEDKKIFCYPWRTNRQLKSHIYMIQKISEIFVMDNSYLFLPVENGTLLREYVNDVVDLSAEQRI